MLAKKIGEKSIYALMSILLSTYSVSCILDSIIPARNEPVIAATPKNFSAAPAYKKHSINPKADSLLV